MKPEPTMTVAQLMELYPEGCSIAPGTPENPGWVSRIVAASSYLSKIANDFPLPPSNGGYLVVDMD